MYGTPLLKRGRDCTRTHVGEPSNEGKDDKTSYWRIVALLFVCLIVLIMASLCSITGCKTKLHGRGMCKKHWYRWYRRGDPTHERFVRTELEIENIKSVLLKKRKISASGCWEWQGAKSPQGYGMLRVGLTPKGVHRVSAFVFLSFDLRSKLLICHKCDNKKCFNPDHLFSGTVADNANDMYSKRRKSNLSLAATA